MMNEQVRTGILPNYCKTIRSNENKMRNLILPWKSRKPIKFYSVCIKVVTKEN